MTSPGANNHDHIGTGDHGETEIQSVSDQWRTYHRQELLELVTVNSISMSDTGYEGYIDINT